MVNIMVSRRPGSSLYEQVAADIRTKINSGEYAPGSRLPAENYLAGQYDVGRDTIRDAMGDLRKEGLIVSRRGYPSTVRKLPERELVKLPKGAHLVARMPTPDECHEHNVPFDGVPVLLVGDRIYAADRYEFVAE
jgi:DNA-binding FadR family transcriptional regulator